MSAHLINLTGKTFDFLTVIELVGRTKGRDTKWRCRCVCGTETIAMGSNIRRGRSGSCGCKKGERISANRAVHGHATQVRSGTYKSWRAMNQRCHDPKNVGYAAYGAAGITVCQRWRDSFEAFLGDMGERPVGKTIDRQDGSLGYFKENCRWATPKEQAANRRRRRAC